MEFFGKPDGAETRPFSHAVRAGNLVWVSGHSAPHDPARGVHRGATPAEEVRNALTFVDALLRQAGSGLEHVVQMTMLLSDRADYGACNAEYVKHFPGGLPARHTALFGVPTEARVGFACVALCVEGGK